MALTNEKRIATYLRGLRKALRGLPRARGQEIVGAIQSHIESELEGLPQPVSETQILEILDRVGDPDEIAAKAREEFGVSTGRVGVAEIGAVILLPLGGVLLPFIGWIIGVVLLWVSSLWTTREKLLGTFVVPFGLALPLYLTVFAVGVSSTTTCVGGPVEVIRGSPGARSDIGTMPECISSGATTFSWPIVPILLAVGSIAMTIYLVRKLYARTRAPSAL